MKIKLALLFLSVFTACGFHALMLYAGNPGTIADAITPWPEASKLNRPKHSHLVMFIHPGCACSKASVSELKRLMAQAPDLTVQVVVMRSPKLEKLFNENPLIEAAKKIPRTEVLYDRDGVEAKLFDAQTSGLTLLYDSNSRLAFSGGLTMARGHEGNSEGKEAILSFLKGESSKTTSLVFGCDIFDKVSSLTMVK
jgi:hypothetical protein